MGITSGDRLGLLPETEFDRRLRERTEAAQQRVAEARERGESGPPDAGPLVEACRRRLMEAGNGHIFVADVPWYLSA